MGPSDSAFSRTLTRPRSSGPCRSVRQSVYDRDVDEETINSSAEPPLNAGDSETIRPSVSSENGSGKRRPRTTRTFPASSFSEALPLAEAIQEHAAGKRVRRLTLFEHMKRSADSGSSRQLVTNSGQYGLTIGSYKAEFLELTPDGALATDDDGAERNRLAARLKLAIEQVDPFNALYEQFKNNRLPAASVLRDFVQEQQLAPEDHIDECVETFLANARDLGLVSTYAGAERVLTFDLVLDAVPTTDLEPRPQDEMPEDDRSARRSAGSPAASPTRVVAEAVDVSDVCFVVTPIGAAGSDQRKHADLVYGSLLEPALAEVGLRLVRADRISKPGVITAQVIDHLVRAPLVIADLSFGNPNVFYELALRHATRKPAVQVVRSSDPLPFDVGQFRTVVIDMSDIYTLVPQIDRHRAEIARQCRAALDEEGHSESPLSLFYPTFWSSL